jgi:hypothetical protein
VQRHEVWLPVKQIGTSLTLELFSVSETLAVLFRVAVGLNDRMIGVRFPAGAGNFSVRHHVQTGSGAHPTSYPMGTGGSFPEGKAAGA